MLRCCFVLLVLAGFLAPAPAVAAPPMSPDPKSLLVPVEELSKARELVQKLGSEVFQDREAAERALAGMGRCARAALLDGVNTDPDPEIRQRCRTLLPKANAEEMKARIDTFMADTEGKYEHDLPGWTKLRATIRGEWKMFGWTYTVRPNANKAARELFIEFLEAPGGRQLLTAMNGDPTQLGQLVATRKQELYNARFPRVPGIGPRNPSVAEVAVVVFAEAQVHSRHVPRSMNISAVLTTSGLIGVVQGTDDRARAMRAVMTAWLDSRTEATDLYTAYTLASQMKNDDAVGRLAIRMMTTPGVLGHYKGLALGTFIRLKMTDQLPALEKALTDTSVLASVSMIVDGKRVIKTIEMRDGALAAAIILTGQDPTEYGFDHNVSSGGFSPTWARITDEKRKEALEKWAKWREKHP
jgi:hypothetical protein